MWWNLHYQKLFIWIYFAIAHKHHRRQAMQLCSFACSLLMCCFVDPNTATRKNIHLVILTSLNLISHRKVGTVDKNAIHIFPSIRSMMDGSILALSIPYFSKDSRIILSESDANVIYNAPPTLSHQRVINCWDGLLVVNGYLQSSLDILILYYFKV